MAEWQEAAEEWRRAFDAIADGLAILSPDGRILRCNRAMAQMAGKSTEDLVGAPASALLPQEDGTTADVVARSLQQVERTVSELTVSDRLLRVVADPIVAADRRVERIVLIVADITEHRQLEEDHRKRAEQLAEVDRRKDEFLGMLAHELRNPLNALGAATSLMDRVGAQDARNVRLRNTVRRQTRHLARLVDDLVEVSRVTRGKLRLQPEPSELVTVLRGAIESTRPTLEARNQNLGIDWPSEPLPMTADPLRLEQVFVNLLQNASKYSEPGSTIAVECTTLRGDQADRALVRISDEGVGIPQDKLESIFDLFVQVDHSLARSLGGLGLGLTIARRLVELHGGAIRAESAGLGKGSAFIVELPVAEVAMFATASGVGRVDEAVDAPSQPLEILVIEDNRDAREMMQDWLEELGHHVYASADGLDGLALARQVAPDVALVDIGLPGIDGYQVAANLRVSAKGRRTLLVAITGYGRPEDSARAREAGFDVHLVKPIQPEQLARIIQRPARTEAADHPRSGAT